MNNTRTILTGNQEWFTPPSILDKIRSVLTEIDLDPATCEQANKTVQAKKYYTKEDNGLCNPCYGRVFVNPPYSRGVVDKFVTKAIEEYNMGHASDMIVLTNAATDTKWWQELVTACNTGVLLKGRVRFMDINGVPSGSPPIGQSIVYFGHKISQFADVFKSEGVMIQ